MTALEDTGTALAGVLRRALRMRLERQDERLDERRDERWNIALTLPVEAGQHDAMAKVAEV